jgi:DNA-3-methyladenine glycosylase II
VGEDADRLRLGFVADGLDGGERVAGALARADEDGKVIVETYGEAAPEAVRSQVGRILSLDADGRGFPGVGERDPVVGALQERYPGLRPVLFWSPYEAAAWAIVGNRIRIAQAARVNARMAEELGEEVAVAGMRERAFPGPSRLEGLRDFPGLSGRKAEWLRALARAAKEGKLEARRLRSLPVEEALAELKELPGIGDFGAELVLLRGAGVRDHLPTKEPRLGRAVAIAYGLKRPPSIGELREISENWRPYRTWVALLLRTMLEDETHEISGEPGNASGGGRRTGA